MKSKNDIIKKLHNKAYNDDNKIVTSDGQRGLLCSNKKSLRCPSLACERSVFSQEDIDKAFDVLFDEVARQIKINKNYGNNIKRN
jgi:hypothetical protein